jgi:hypothetical protein
MAFDLSLAKKVFKLLASKAAKGSCLAGRKYATLVECQS